MEANEIADRVALCARVFDAWPNARPTNRDRTLLEYVNATRGVPLAHLGECIQLAIDAGGEFMPPAGEIVRRAATTKCGGKVIGTDADSRYRHELAVSRIVAGYRSLGDAIAPVIPEELLGQPSLPMLSERATR